MGCKEENAEEIGDKMGLGRGRASKNREETEGGGEEDDDDEGEEEEVYPTGELEGANG